MKKDEKETSVDEVLACKCCGYHTEQVKKYNGKCYQCYVDEGSPSQEFLENNCY